MLLLTLLLLKRLFEGRRNFAHPSFTNPLDKRMRFAPFLLSCVPTVLLSALSAGEAQVPTALEASGAVQPGDTIVSVNGIPLPGAGCYRKDAALLEAPGMFPMRLRIRRAGAAAEDADGGYAEGFVDPAKGGRGAQALEGSLSRLKQVGYRSFRALMLACCCYVCLRCFVFPFLQDICSSAVCLCIAF